MSVEYTFNASALGVAGQYIQRGEEIVVPSLASVALASTGGDGTAEVTDFKSDAITFTRAHSRVSGRKGEDDVYTTESETVIEDLRIFGKLSFKRLRAVVTSTRDASEQDEEEGAFSVTAEYEGVMVDDCVIAPAVDDERCQASYRWHHSHVMRSRGPAFGAGGMGPNASAERGDPVRTSVVKALPVQFLSRACVETDGRNILTVPGIGRIYFGELLVKRGKRRLNLLRIDLGPQPGEDTTKTKYVADSGVLSIGSGDGNGEPIWPRN